MATWKFVPDTGEVSGSHSDMPLVIIPSETEMGALTSAEADSVRVYTDASLTTEIPREIVNNDEIHIKPGTVSTSLEVYVDFDGVRSDYGVTATYGRNNVWSDYAAVFHMEEDPSGSAPQMVDSTGNGDGTSNGTMASGDSVSGQLGNALDFDGTDDYISVSDAAYLDITEATIQGWVNPGENGDIDFVMKPAAATYTSPFASYLLRLQMRSGTSNDGPIFGINGGGTFRSSGISATTLSFSTWYMIHGTFDGSTVESYLDGSSSSSSSYTGSITSSTYDLELGNRATGSQFRESIIDEIRIRDAAMSSTWISTEYNNQNDNAAFWVATEETGGATFKTPVVFF